MIGEWNLKSYFNDGREVKWGEDLTEEEMDALRKGEVFTLMKDGKPVKCVLMDSYDSIRDATIETP